MKPKIPKYKREKAEQIRRDREAWEARGNERTILPPSGQATDKTVNEGKSYEDR